MATILSAKTAAGVQPKGTTVGLVAVTSSYSLAASLSSGDVIQMVKVPKGATPIFVSVSGTPGGNATCSVGDGISNSRYINNMLSSATMAVAVINTAYVPYTYSTEDTIDIRVSLASGAMLVSGAFNMTAIFTMDP